MIIYQKILAILINHLRPGNWKNAANLVTSNYSELGGLQEKYFICLSLSE